KSSWIVIEYHPLVHKNLLVWFDEHMHVNRLHLNNHNEHNDTMLLPCAHHQSFDERLYESFHDVMHSTYDQRLLISYHFQLYLLLTSILYEIPFLLEEIFVQII